VCRDNVQLEAKFLKERGWTEVSASIGASRAARATRALSDCCSLSKLSNLCSAGTLICCAYQMMQNSECQPGIILASPLG